jgi:1-deoxy-D-xylulose-5-phosphate reductoisomerase
VHCLVEFTDGTMLAQLSPPSMTFPIQHALLHPERAPGVDSALDFSRLVALEFRPVDEGRFPMLRLAKASMSAGGVAPAVYNAANELAVAAFLDGKIPFLAIPQVVEQSLGAIKNFEPTDLAAVLAIDAESRRIAAVRIQALSR